MVIRFPNRAPEGTFGQFDAAIAEPRIDPLAALSLHRQGLADRGYLDATPAR